MADRAKKITDLPSATAAVGSDIFIIVANTSGVATTKQITTNAFSQSFANIVVGAANSSYMGLVTIGDRLTVENANTGLINVRLANSDVHGVVAQGNNIYINSNGYIGVVGANSTTRGVVSIGNNITVSNTSEISIPYGNASSHGVVAQGNNVYINANGFIGVVGANSTTRGVIRTSSNFSVDANSTLTLAANVDLSAVVVSDATFTGNVYMGIASSNASQLLHFHGTVHSDFIPHTPNNYSLGNNTHTWLNAYVDGLVIGNSGISATTNVSITSDAAVVFTANTNRLTFTGSVPANSTATGTTGDIAFDSNYIYYCVATNTWKRAALSTW